MVSLILKTVKCDDDWMAARVSLFRFCEILFTRLEQSFRSALDRGSSQSTTTADKI